MDKISYHKGSSKGYPKGKRTKAHVGDIVIIVKAHHGLMKGLKGKVIEIGNRTKEVSDIAKFVDWWYRVRFENGRTSKLQTGAYWKVVK